MVRLIPPPKPKSCVEQMIDDCRSELERADLSQVRRRTLEGQLARWLTLYPQEPDLPLEEGTKIMRTVRADR